MKRWLVGLALAGLGVCLFLVWGFLETRRGPNQPPCRLAEEGRSVKVWARPALASPVLRRLSTGKRVSLLPVSQVLAVAWVRGTERPPGPPGLDPRGPPGRAAGTSVDLGAAGQAGSPEEGRGTSEFWGGIGRLLEVEGFATPFS